MLCFLSCDQTKSTTWTSKQCGPSFASAFVIVSACAQYGSRLVAIPYGALLYHSLNIFFTNTLKPVLKTSRNLFVLLRSEFDTFFPFSHCSVIVLLW